MLSNSSKYFSQYLEGDDDALLRLIEEERSLVFDYLVRMTGEIERSLNSYDEVSLAAAADAAKCRDYSTFREVLYTAARRMNHVAWNVNTSKLENEGLNAARDEALLAKVDEARARELESAFRQLPLPEREALILRVRTGFKLKAVARIMGVSEAQVAESLSRGKARLEKMLTTNFILPQDIMLMIQHPIPSESINSTIALSQLIANVEKAKRRPFHGLSRRLLTIAVFAAVAATVYVVLSKVLVETKVQQEVEGRKLRKKSR